MKKPSLPNFERERRYDYPPIQKAPSYTIKLDKRLLYKGPSEHIARLILNMFERDTGPIYS